MKLVIRIQCDNAAFDNSEGTDKLPDEVRRIFEVIYAQLRDWSHNENKWNTIRDINGNDVGRWKIADDEYWRHDGE